MSGLTSTSTSANIPEEQQILARWEADDQDSLFDVLRIGERDWRMRADVLLTIFAANRVATTSAAKLAHQFETNLRSMGMTFKADSWRGYMAPRILESSGDFADTAGVAHAASKSLNMSGYNQWQALEDWLAEWLEYVLDYAAPQEQPLDVLEARRLLPAAGLGDDKTPAILHPLMLRSLRRLLQEPRYQSVVFPLGEWLTQSVFKTPLPKVTVETVIAAGPLVWELAQRNNTANPNTPIDWQNVVVKTVVDNSERRNGLLPGWQGKQERIQELLDECEYWQQAPVANELLNAAEKSLRPQYDGLNLALEQAESQLDIAWFSPGFESAARTELPDRRGSKAFWQDGWWNGTGDSYYKVLQDLTARREVAKGALETARQQATTIQTSRDAFDDVFASPLAKAAFVRMLRSGTGQQAEHPLFATFKSEKAQQCGFRSAMFDPAHQLLTESRAWTDAINASTSDGDVGKILETWGALEVWDGRRGQYTSKDQEATALLEQLPQWLKEAGDIPDSVEVGQLRPALAGVTHMVDLEHASNVTKRLNALLDAKTSDDPLYALLAAARLDLGLTQVARGKAPADAFGQLIGGSGEMSKLLDWAEAALNSQVAWESRAGMNLLILLARLADLTDDLFIAAALHDRLNQSDRFKHLVQKAIQCLLQELTDGTAWGSKLPLAYVASDLARFARTIAAGIVHSTGSLIIKPPVWLTMQDANGNLIANAGSFIDAFSGEIRAAQLENLRGLIGISGLPARLLLLAVLQIEMDRFERRRRLWVRAPRKVEVAPLTELRRVARVVFCTEYLLLHGEQALNRNRSDGDIIPWWQAQFWCNANRADSTDAAGVASTDLPIVNWLPAASVDVRANALMTAAVLEASVPPTPPDAGSTRTGRGGETLLIYADRYLRDIDGRLEGEFPVFSWRTARDALVDSVAKLENSESKYLNALKAQGAAARSATMIQWLQEPLRMSTSDFEEQFEAAVAEVRQAEAELAIAQHESIAAMLEQAASELIYKAAEVEVKRQKTLVEISALDIQIEKKKAEIGRIEQKVQEGQLDRANADREIAGIRIRQAELEVEKAVKAKAQLQQQIDMLKEALGDPTQSPLKVDRGDGEMELANGQIAVMAVKIQYSLDKKLQDAQTKAKQELEEAREEARSSLWGSIVKGICTAIGTVVGAYFGVPALGAMIGGAIGELGMGIIQGKSAGEIVFGLADNAFDIAGAAGFDLEKELNTLGAKGLAEIDNLLDTAQQSLGPILDSLPRVFDQRFIQDGLAVLGLEEASELAQLATEVFGSLKQDFGAFSGAVAAEGGLGTILQNASMFDTPEAFRQHLEDALFKNVFPNTTALTDRAKELARAVGKDVSTLANDRDAQKQVAERVATLAVTKLSKSGSSFRVSVVSKWLGEQQTNGRKWDDVQSGAKELLENLFPDPKVRAEMEASLRSALLDPKIKRAAIEGYLKPWQEELDKKLKQITDMQPDLGSGANRVEIAEANVRYLEQAQAQFKNELIPFLKSEPGHDGVRDNLWMRLDVLKAELDKAALTVEQVALGLNITEIELKNADITVAQAENLVAKARETVHELDLGIDKATLMSHVVGLSQLQSANLQDAKEMSNRAAAERANAASARVTAAQAALDARRAYMLAARRRKDEAIRIRSALSRPPITLDFSANSAAVARKEHEKALEIALKAYRELVRFYVSIGVPQSNPALLPDEMWGSEQKTWSDWYQNWMGSTTDTFTAPGVVTTKTELIEYDLTPRQIAALASKGFRLVCRPSEYESPPEDSVLFQIGSTEAQLSAAQWQEVFAAHRMPLTGGEQYQPSPDSLPLTIEDSIKQVVVSSHPHRWSIPDGRKYQIKIVDGIRQVSERREYKTMLEDRIIEGLAKEHLDNGRIVGIFLTIPNRKSPGQILRGGDYTLETKHLGDVFLSDREAKLRIARTLNMLPERYHFIQETMNPEDVLLRQSALAEREGDPQHLVIQGLPIAGTTILRLIAQGSVEFEEVKLRVLYKYYTYTRTAATPSAGSAGAIA